MGAQFVTACSKISDLLCAVASVPVVGSPAGQTPRDLVGSVVPIGQRDEVRLKAVQTQVNSPDDERVLLGSLLAEIGRAVGGVELEIDRDDVPHEPVDLA